MIFTQFSDIITPFLLKWSYFIMKKENKQLARARKAQQKKQAAQAAKLKKISIYAIPALICVALMVWALLSTPSSSEKSDLILSLKKDTSLEIVNGDTVNIDFVGSIDGVEFEGGSTKGQGTDLKIGSKSYIDDFEEQLIGAHPGDVVDVYATFPENYRETELAGKEALFKVTVNGIYRN